MRTDIERRLDRLEETTGSHRQVVILFGCKRPDDAVQTTVSEGITIHYGFKVGKIKTEPLPSTGQVAVGALCIVSPVEFPAKIRAAARAGGTGQLPSATGQTDLH
jgi:hypothetical protein